MRTDAAAGEAALRLVDRLREATNNHDPDGVAACFTTDYRSETPAHPTRAFTGPDQVRRNQEKIFTFVPDLTVELLAPPWTATRSGRNGSTAVSGRTARRTICEA